jgi:2-methylcitrate dehydratase PrpD
MSQPSLTQQLATALSAFDPAGLAGEDLRFAKLFVLDWLASAIAGTTSDAGRMLIEEGRERGCGTCRVLGLDDGRDAEAAALINGGLSHIVEMDDLDRGSVVHPGTVVIPAALAAAETVETSGLRFLLAVVVGYEAAIRVGEAVGRSHYRYWQNTATCGTFGAAAAAGVVLGLDAERMTWALGTAGSVAGGLWQFNHDGAMTKHLHAGRAASTGLLAARLARRGFTGAREILEGPQGFFAAMSTDAQPRRVTAGLERGLGTHGCGWKIAGVSIKPHASCRHTHPAVDAARVLRDRLGGDLAGVGRVRVETYGTALQVTDTPNPTNAYQAKFSLQYCTAQALLHGQVGLHDFTPERLADPATRKLMTRIELAVDPEIDSGYPAVWSARVTAECVDGTTAVAEVNAPKGDPENAVSWEEVVAKCGDLARGTAFEGIVEQLVADVDELDNRRSMRGFLPVPGETRV